MNDQRASLPFLPGLQHPAEVLVPLIKVRQQSLLNGPDDDLIEMLMRCQSNRIEEQRSELPERPVGVTVPEEDFFQLLTKMQAGRYSFL